jgi:hypothetical protein
VAQSIERARNRHWQHVAIFVAEIFAITCERHVVRGRSLRDIAICSEPLEPLAVAELGLGFDQ